MHACKYKHLNGMSRKSEYKLDIYIWWSVSFFFFHSVHLLTTQYAHIYIYV